MEKIIQSVCDVLISPEAGRIDARRCFHGRGHCYEGLEHINVDYYAPVLLITLYRECEPGALEQLLAGLELALTEYLPGLSILVQHRYKPRSPSEVMFGVLPADIFARCSGRKMRLKLLDNQNIGYFIDMQESHDWLMRQARDLSILNLFSYTCAFSVAALQGGA